VKRTKLRKQGKAKISVIQRKLWELCKQITRKRYGNTCFTCERTGLEGSNFHTGHFLPKGSCGSFLKYDLRNLRPQCYNCNINLGGNGAIFARQLALREGNDYVDKLFQDRNVSVKALDHYIWLIEKYKIILEEL